jgi:hypothetical protein
MALDTRTCGRSPWATSLKTVAVETPRRPATARTESRWPLFSRPPPAARLLRAMARSWSWAGRGPRAGAETRASPGQPETRPRGRREWFRCSGKAEDGWGRTRPRLRSRRPGVRIPYRAPSPRPESFQILGRLRPRSFRRAPRVATGWQTARTLRPRRPPPGPRPVPPREAETRAGPRRRIGGVPNQLDGVAERLTVVARRHRAEARGRPTDPALGRRRHLRPGPGRLALSRGAGTTPPPSLRSRRPVTGRPVREAAWGFAREAHGVPESGPPPDQRRPVRDAPA